MTRRLYFDTYALVEIYKSNPNYDKYKKNFEVLLNKLNLMEFAYFLLREGKKDDINKYFDGLLKYNIDYDAEALIQASEMKFKFLKERLSFIDCLGYIIAKRNNAKFLTGDEKFRKMEYVEFVK